MFCSKCGKEINNSDFFCSNCGNELHKNNKVPEAPNIDFSKRVLCSDGNCIGIIGNDGLCSLCKKPYSQNNDQNDLDKNNENILKKRVKKEEKREKIILTLIIVFIAIYFAFYSKNNSGKDEKIICDKFDIEAKFINENPLKIEYQLIDTDLPDDTEISVYMYMYYLLESEKEAQGIEYYKLQSTVANIKQKQTVLIEKSKIEFEINKFRRRNIQYNMPFALKEISNEIDFEILVPLQENQRFGPNNENLKGKMVDNSSLGINIIKVKKRLNAPIQQVVNQSKWENFTPKPIPGKLAVGSRYKLSRETPVWQKNTPDFYNTLQNLPAGAIIMIKKALYEEPFSTEYMIESKLNNGSTVIGWISVTALIGQDLELIENK